MITRLGWRTAGLVATALDPSTGGSVTWTERRNQLEAFSAFANAVRVRLDAYDSRSRDAFIDRHSRFRGIWAAEGLGYGFAQNEARTCRLSARTGLNGGLSKLNAKAKLPWHAGTGLALAMLWLDKHRAYSVDAAWEPFVEGFIRDCSAKAQPGFFLAAFESLGLAARQLHPRHLAAIAKVLATADSRLHDCFWHGVGRGLYFAPTNLVPNCNLASCGIREAQSGPGNEASRANAVAGVAWALTLVNIRNPEVLEACLDRYGDRIGDLDAFSNGVTSALMVWNDWVPNSIEVARFLSHVPQPGNATAHQRWNQYIRQSANQALAHVYPMLKAANRLDELFYYRPTDS